MRTNKRTAEEVKETVQSKYNQINEQPKDYNASSCCGSGQAFQEVYNIMTDDYSEVEGYSKDADLGLGCGLPTQFALISEGVTIIDLGSGAGNDCFVARHETGSTQHSGSGINIISPGRLIQKSMLIRRSKY